MAAHHGSLVRVGGMVAKNEAGKTGRSRVGRGRRAVRRREGRVATDARPCRRRARRTTPRSSATRCTSRADGKLGAGPKQWQETLLTLDLAAATPAWKSVPQPFTRRGVAAVQFGANLAVIGGLDPSEKVSPLVDVYDVANKRWSRGPDFPGEGFGVAAVAIGGAVYASGKDGVIYRLAPEDKAWSRVGSLAFPRFFHQIVGHARRAPRLLRRHRVEARRADARGRSHRPEEAGPDRRANRTEESGRGEEPAGRLLPRRHAVPLRRQQQPRAARLRTRAVPKRSTRAAPRVAQVAPDGAVSRPPPDDANRLGERLRLRARRFRSRRHDGARARRSVSLRPEARRVGAEKNRASVAAYAVWRRRVRRQAVGHRRARLRRHARFEGPLSPPRLGARRVDRQAGGGVHRSARAAPQRAPRVRRRRAGQGRTTSSAA